MFPFTIQDGSGRLSRVELESTLVSLLSMERVSSPAAQREILKDIFRELVSKLVKLVKGFDCKNLLRMPTVTVSSQERSLLRPRPTVKCSRSKGEQKFDGLKLFKNF